MGRWTSLVFFVRKKDAGLRMVIDYRRLNKQTVKEGFPMPDIDQILDNMGGASWYSTLDAASGYWRVPMAEDSIEKTGFITRWGAYEWLVMAFGMTSAGYTFQKLMMQLLAPYLGHFAWVFIDDIIIYSRSLEEHLEHLRIVFDVCRTANLRLRLEKCQFAKRSVEYLGHLVSSEGLQPSPRNIRKALDMSTPTNVNQVRSYLGTVSYFRRFVMDYATLAEPFTRLLKKDVAFVWGKEQQDAFDILKNKLTSPPILSYPDQELVQVLTTDASTKGLGAVLSQMPRDKPEQEQVVAYASRALRGPELNYATTHQEALAVVWAAQQV